MSLFYDLSIGVYLPQLHNIINAMKKAEEHAKSAGITTSELAESRIIEDMLPFTFQIKTVIAQVTTTAHVLGGQPKIELEEGKTFEDMYKNIQTAIEYIQKVKPEDLVGKEKEIVVIPTPRGDLKWTGLDYLRQFALLNFWFHWTTAYDILRAKGVPVGKRDMLGQLNLL